MRIRLHAPFRRKPPLTNRERNIQRILHPPGPTLPERLGRPVRAAEDRWCRHVSQRELHRQLDAMALAFRASRPTEWDEP